MTARSDRARTNAGAGLDYKQWCKALLRHYFSAASNTHAYNEPVRHLAVSDYELQLASGLGSPEEARNDLVEVFRRELRESPFQTVYRDEKVSIHEPPQTILPVIVSSLVAAEYTSDERYRSSFNEICGNNRDNDTWTLPLLWQHLRNWLRACRESEDPPFSVRELALPTRPAAGWRNIFYALHLTFPHRRDRDELQSRLAVFDDEPTVAEVLSVVEKRAAKFSEPFQYYLEDFRKLPTHSPLHPFWYAVQNAWQALHGVADEQLHVRLRAQVVSGDCHAYLLVDAADLAPTGYGSRFAPTIDSTSPYVLVDADGNYGAPVLDVLSGSLRLGKLAHDVANGVVALVDGGGRMFEWVGGLPRSRDGIALVHTRALAGFQNTVESRGGTPGNVGSALALDWRLVTDVRYGGDGDEVLPLTSARAQLAVVSGTGVAYANGYLGSPGFLPKVESAYATSVDSHATEGSGHVELKKSDAGLWLLPDVPMHGRWTVTARDDEGNALGQILLNFVTPPSHSEFLEPSDAQCNRMMIEGGQQDLEPLERHLPCVADSNEAFVPGGALFLGPVVGAWSKSHETGYDWLANRTNQTLTFVGDPEIPSLPVANALSKSAARFWRECFTKFRVANPSSAIGEVHNLYREMAHRRNLPRVESTLRRPLLEGSRRAADVPSDAGVERFLIALATVSTRVAGIEEAELFQLIDLSFGVMDWKLKWLVLRAWLDAGVVELAIDTRWPTRRYFCRRPRLVFADASKNEAAIVGGLLPAVVDRVSKCVADAGGQAAFGATLSPFAPRLLRCTNLGKDIEARLKHEHFAPAVIAQQPSAVVTAVSAIVDPGRCPEPDVWRERDARVWQWDEGHFAWTSRVTPVMLRLLQVPRQPDRYELIVDGRLRWWTQSRTWAFLAAFEFAARNPFATTEGMLVVQGKTGAQLPVRVANALAISTGVTAGANTNGRYQYFAGSDSAAAGVIHRLLPFSQRKDSGRA